MQLGRGLVWVALLLRASGIGDGLLYRSGFAFSRYHQDLGVGAHCSQSQALEKTMKSESRIALYVLIPRDLKRRLRHLAADSDRTITQLVVAALNNLGPASEQVNSAVE